MPGSYWFGQLQRPSPAHLRLPGGGLVASAPTILADKRLKPFEFAAPDGLHVAVAPRVSRCGGTAESDGAQHMRSHEELTACKRGPFAVPVTIFLSLMRSYSKIKCLVITEYVESSANFQVAFSVRLNYSFGFRRRRRCQFDGCVLALASVPSLDSLGLTSPRCSIRIGGMPGRKSL
jgi:hypothetical protein